MARAALIDVLGFATIEETVESLNAQIASLRASDTARGHQIDLQQAEILQIKQVSPSN